MATTSAENGLDTKPPELRSSLTPEQVAQPSQPPNDPETLPNEHKLALSFLDGGNYTAAEELLRRNLVARQRVLGTTHADTLATMHCLGLAQSKLGSFDEGEKTYRELIPLYEKPGAALGARSNLGWVLNREGKYGEAETVLRALLPDLKERFAGDDPRVLGCLRHLMEAVGGQGRVDEALGLNEEGMELVMKMSGEYKSDELKAMKDMRTQLQEWKNKA